MYTQTKNIIARTHCKTSFLVKYVKSYQ